MSENYLGYSSWDLFDRSKICFVAEAVGPSLDFVARDLVLPRPNRPRAEAAAAGAIGHWDRLRHPNCPRCFGAAGSDHPTTIR